MIDGCSSDSRELLCGVPQGSILGPILFSIYLLGINEVFASFDIGYVIYADDILLLTPSAPSNLASTAKNLADCINSTSDWLSNHGLLLNKSKTECVLFGTPSLIAKSPVSELRLNDHNIQFAKAVRYLGVTLDETLSLKAHVNNTCHAAFGYLRVISKQKKAMKTSAVKILLHSLVLSRIEFCSSIFYGATNQLQSRLQMVSNSSLRILAGLRKFDHLSAAREKYFWLSVQDRQLLRLACIIFVAIKYGLPQYLANSLKEKVFDRRTRFSQLHPLEIARTRSGVGDLAFSVAGPSVWNTIPTDIRASKTLSSFRRRLKKYLLDGGV
jgi:hypothetical protein